jgi:hypothetical protein
MIYDCYTMDVYCEMEGHDDSHPNGLEMPQTYTGRNKRACDDQRRKAGWVKVNGKDCCRSCRKRLSLPPWMK